MKTEINKELIFYTFNLSIIYINYFNKPSRFHMKLSLKGRLVGRRVLKKKKCNMGYQ